MRLSTIAQLEKQMFAEKFREAEKWKQESQEDRKGFIPIPPRNVGFPRSQVEKEITRLWKDPSFYGKLAKMDPAATNPSKKTRIII